jgi:hypothetical protein
VNDIEVYVYLVQFVNFLFLSSRFFSSCSTFQCVQTYTTPNWQSTANQRERKQRKLYSDEWALGEEEYEGARGFSIAEKLESARFAQSGMVREMYGKDLNVG